MTDWERQKAKGKQAKGVKVGGRYVGMQGK